MAKFVNKDLRLKDGQKVTFGDGFDASLTFNGVEFGVDTTMSGVYPTQDQHLTTKYYVDEVVTSVSGGSFDHGLLTGLDSDDHTQYSLVSGTRDYVGIVRYNDNKTFTSDTDIVAKKYVDDSITTATASGAIDHGSLAGLGDDDHTHYSLVDGTRAFTGEVVGIDPTVSGSLATKHYVDSQDALQTSIYEHGRQAIGDGASTVSIVFSSALANTNYTINCTMENTSDSPPSIYAFIVSAKLTTGFTCSMMGDTDSANYVMNWSVIS